MRQIWRLGVLAMLALVAFAVAIERFDDAAETGCAQRAREDASYEAQFLDEPQIELLTYRVEITREGEVVEGADVCLSAYMQGMSAMATTDAGREVEPGIYELSLTFEMGGRWSGRVLVVEPGQPVAAIPLTLEIPSEEEPTATSE
ncbi:MAG: FixH family protein [Acidimicrobiia bacterium]|jgi:hypothetical protein|nr:FixH family protein [Acidimicrobiia bacterium]